MLSEKVVHGYDFTSELDFHVDLIAYKRAYPDAWPDPVDGDFVISQNGLHTLKGCPVEIQGSFYCNNNHLTTLHFGPINVKDYYSCSYNELISIEDAPKEVKGFMCNSNKLTNLKGIGRKYLTKCTGFNLQNNNFISHIAGLMLVEGLPFITYDRQNQPYGEIINDCLKNRDDLTDCQEALIDAGYRDMAKL